MLRALAVATAVSLVVSACGDRATTRSPRGPQATFRHLVGLWIGHTRQLYIHSDGTIREVVNDGCCSNITDFHLRVLSVAGPPRRAVAVAQVVSITHLNKPVLAENHVAPPHVGDLDTLRLRHRIVTDGVTRVTFCSDKPPYLPGSPCGA